jgi:hypothetical protein
MVEIVDRFDKGQRWRSWGCQGVRVVNAIAGRNPL